jgi:hypothetical protein
MARAGAADLTPSARWTAAVLIGYVAGYTRHNDGVPAERLLPIAHQPIRTLRRGSGRRRRGGRLSPRPRPR